MRNRIPFSSQSAGHSGEYSPELPLSDEEAASAADTRAWVLRGKWLILALAVAGLGIAKFKHRADPPVYQSTAQLLLTKLTEEAPLRHEVDDTFRPDLETQMVVIRSPKIVEQAIVRYELAKLPSFAGDPEPLATLARGLSVMHQQGTNGVLRLAFKGPVANDCEAVVRAVARTYGDSLRENRRTFNEETVTMITEAKQNLLRELNDKEAEYRRFRSAAPPIWNGDEKSNVHRQRFAEIEKARADVMIKRSQLEAELRTVENAQRSGVSEATLLKLVRSLAGESGMLDERLDRDADHSAQLTALLLQEQTLTQEYGSQYPQLKDVRDRITLLKGLARDSGRGGEAELSREKRNLVRTYVEALTHHVLAYDEKSQELAKLCMLERDAAKRYLETEYEDEHYREELQRMKSLFDAVVARLGEVDLAKDLGGYNMEILTPATLGVQVAPQLTLYLAVGGLIGGCLGAALAFVKFSLWQRPALGEICDRIGLPVVARLPALKAFAAADGALDGILRTHSEPLSRYAESIRAVRLALFFGGGAPRVVQICSAAPGEGKSSLAANLAISIAGSGKRTLLIDADLRKPRIHELFGLGNDAGTVSVVRGDVDLLSACQTTAVPNLNCLTCGPRPENPAELLASVAFEQLLEAARVEFDYVLVDTPPLLAVTDGRVVAARVDGVFLLSKSDLRDRGQNLADAAQILRAVAANVLGVVANRSSESSQPGSDAYFNAWPVVPEPAAPEAELPPPESTVPELSAS